MEWSSCLVRLVLLKSNPKPPRRKRVTSELFWTVVLVDIGVGPRVKWLRLRVAVYVSTGLWIKEDQDRLRTMMEGGGVPYVELFSHLFFGAAVFKGGCLAVLGGDGRLRFLRRDSSEHRPKGVTAADGTQPIGIAPAGNPIGESTWQEMLCLGRATSEDPRSVFFSLSHSQPLAIVLLADGSLRLHHLQVRRLFPLFMFPSV